MSQVCSCVHFMYSHVAPSGGYSLLNSPVFVQMKSQPNKVKSALYSNGDLTVYQ